MTAETVLGILAFAVGVGALIAALLTTDRRRVHIVAIVVSLTTLLLVGAVFVKEWHSRREAIKDAELGIRGRRRPARKHDGGRHIRGGQRTPTAGSRQSGEICYSMHCVLPRGQGCTSRQHPGVAGHECEYPPHASLSSLIQWSLAMQRHSLGMCIVHPAAIVMHLSRQNFCFLAIFLIAIGVPVILAYKWTKHNNEIDRIELEIVGTMGARLLTADDIFQEIGPNLTRIAEFNIDDASEALNRSIGDGRVTYVIRTCKDLVGYDHACRFYYTTW